MTDEAGLDTPLARLLHQRGRLPLETLRVVLAEARAARGPGVDEGASLAARLVERALLSAAEAEEALRELRDPTAAPRAPGASGGAVPGGDDWVPGVDVGEYRIVRRLGAGGMGTVDLGEHRATGAMRAIKSLAASADPELVLRFRREAEALARLDGHPNVVRIHTVGQAAGRHYLVMDLAAGGDLLARVRAAPLPALEAARLGVALCRGLEHAHRNGVLHRDLKPQNVLFDAPGPDATPVLVDFGLARATDTASLTATGELLGTPAYMAPEQARGEREGLSPATDVYGVGALLFHALTGRPPFVGASPFAVLARVLSEAPPPLRSLAPDVPVALERVVARALEKAPADRWPSALALGAALEAFSSGAPGRGRRGGRIALAIVASVAVVFALVGAWRRTAAPPAEGAPGSAATTGSDATTDVATRPLTLEERAREARLERVRDLARAGDLARASSVAGADVPPELRWPIGLCRAGQQVDVDLAAAADHVLALEGPVPDDQAALGRTIAARALRTATRQADALRDAKAWPLPAAGWRPIVRGLALVRRLDAAADVRPAVHVLVDLACGETTKGDTDLALALPALAPDDLVTQRDVGQFAMRQRDPAEKARYLPFLLRAAELCPDRGSRDEVEVIAVEVLAEVGRTEECLTRSDRVLAGLEDVSLELRVRTARGIALRARAELSASLRELDRARALGPGYYTRYQRAITLLALGRDEDTLDQAVEYVKVAPSADSIEHDVMATLVWRLGHRRPGRRDDVALAVARVLGSTSVRPATPNWWARSALLSLETGDAAGTRRALERACSDARTQGPDDQVIPTAGRRCAELAGRLAAGEALPSVEPDLRALVSDVDVGPIVKGR